MRRKHQFKHVYIGFYASLYPRKYFTPKARRTFLAFHKDLEKFDFIQDCDKLSYKASFLTVKIKLTLPVYIFRTNDKNFITDQQFLLNWQ